jgi:D-alanine-D-alanine ligase
MKQKKSTYRVLVLLDPDLMPPDSLEGKEAKEIEKWRIEYVVITALRKAGHEVMKLGLRDELSVVRPAIENFKPHIAFNLLEEFAGSATMIQNVVGYLELMKVQYTGCNPRGLMLAHDKALSKKILAYHRISVPQFAVFPLNRRIRRRSKLKFPLLVKSVTEEGSVGISQASVVYDEEKLVERVEFIHRNIGTHAIAEEYIDGREIYVGVIGNNRLKTMPPWELIIKHLPEGAPNIATLKVKWNLKYQTKVGVVTEAAQNLTPEQQRMIEQLSKRIYRLLELSGYARLDFRMREDGKFFLIEANPNPQMREDEDFAQSAKLSGITYVKLVNEIIRAGLSYEYVNLP